MTVWRFEVSKAKLTQLSNYFDQTSEEELIQAIKDETRINKEGRNNLQDYLEEIAENMGGQSIRETRGYRNKDKLVKVDLPYFEVSFSFGQAIRNSKIRQKIEDLFANASALFSLRAEDDFEDTPDVSVNLTPKLKQFAKDIYETANDVLASPAKPKEKLRRASGLAQLWEVMKTNGDTPLEQIQHKLAKELEAEQSQERGWERG